MDREVIPTAAGLSSNERKQLVGPEGISEAL
jgi:hypothetical protein